MIRFYVFSALCSKIKQIIKTHLITTDILVTFFLLIIFGTIYLAIPKKLTDSAIISPLQKEQIDKKSNSVSNSLGREVIGFLPSWIVAQGTKISISKLTQLIYFGFNVNENGDIVKYAEDGKSVLEWHYFNSENFIKIKKEAKENKTKVLVSFKMFNNESIDNLISNASSTNYFIKNAVELLKKYDLDGINLDIEYFTDSDFPTSKFLNSFLEKVSKAVKEINSNYIVSVDVNATVVLSDKAYDMVKIGEVADHVILMAYDYYRQSSLRAGPVAPLYGTINSHSVNESVISLFGRVPLEKIILGIPFYGYEWQTLNKKYNSTSVSDSGALATYKRVRELLENRKDVEEHWDEEAQSPWLLYSQSGAIKQIYYENIKSLKAKVDFAENKELAGIAVFALGYEGKYHEIWDIIEK